MAKPIKSNNRRRYCRLGSCKRLLSIYNHSVYCHAHRHVELQKQPSSASSVK